MCIGNPRLKTKLRTKRLEFCEGIKMRIVQNTQEKGKIALQYSIQHKLGVTRT